MAEIHYHQVAPRQHPHSADSRSKSVAAQRMRRTVSVFQRDGNGIGELQKITAPAAQHLFRLRVFVAGGREDGAVESGVPAEDFVKPPDFTAPESPPFHYLSPAENSHLHATVAYINNQVHTLTHANVFVPPAPAGVLSARNAPFSRRFSRRYPLRPTPRRASGRVSPRPGPCLLPL
mgnify:CR=1 FL=1